MATILVVDDRASNREFITTLLGYFGHELLEASDGQEALDITVQKRPDLVIADILMPRMDGYEYVQKLRSNPLVADTVVAFYTATYRVREAGALAAACGVKYLIPKPSEPQVVLDIVNEALGIASSKPASEPARSAVPVHGGIGDNMTGYLTDLQVVGDKLSALVIPGPETPVEREQLRRIDESLSQTVVNLQQAATRLTGLLDLGLQMVAERDPERLFRMFVESARKIVEAQLCGLVLLADNEKAYRQLTGSDQGLTDESVGPSWGPETQELLAKVIRSHQPVRAHHLMLAPEQLGLPSTTGTIHSFVGVPVVACDRLAAVVFLVNRAGTLAFTNEDERIVLAVASRLGFIYESLRLNDELQTRAASLRVEVAERKRSEEALRKSQERYRMLAEQLRVSEMRLNLALECGGVGTWDWDFLTNRHDWDLRCKQIYGLLPTEEGSVEQFYRVLHPHDRSRLEGLLEAILDPTSNGDYEAEFRVIPDASAPRHLMARGRVLFENAQPVRFMGTVVDITKQKRNEEALRRSQALLAESQAIAHLGSFEIDLASGQMHVSDQVYSLFDFDRFPEPLTREQLLERISAEDLDRERNVLEGNLRGQDTAITRFRVIRRDGTARTLEQRAHLESDSEQGGCALVGTLQDITEQVESEARRLKLQQEIQRADKLESLSVLAGGVAHDFNNLLTGIIGYADLALSDLPEDSPACDSIENVKQCSLHAAELSSLMLAYSGRGRFRVGAVDINQVIEDTLQNVKPVVSKRARLKADLAPGLAAAQADAAQVRQIILNLVTNASEAITPCAGMIEVKTGACHIESDSIMQFVESQSLAAGDYVWIEVRDNGSGIDASAQTRIFEPFFSTKFTGRGLGLAAVLGIVRGHRGAIQVESKPGTGTTFRVFLPVSQKPARRVVKRLSAELRLHPGALILVVDDEESVRETTRRILEHKGFRVITGSNGLEGVRLVRQHAHEVVAVLLDLTMPVMNGREALHEMRSLRPDLPVLITSGYVEDDALAQLGEDRHYATGFISKPFGFEELAFRLNTLLKGAPPEHEAAACASAR